MQTVIRFAAAPELEVPPGSTISMEVWEDGVRQHETGQLRGPVEFFDDIKLTVDARDDDADRRFTVFAELVGPGGDRLSWARVRSGFVADSLSEVRVRFALGCPDPADRMDQPADFDPEATCGSHDTCIVSEGGGVCASACVDPEPFGPALREEASAALTCPQSDCSALERVDVGWDNSCALVDGEVFCWGRTSFAPGEAWFRRPSRIFDERDRARPDPARPIVDVAIHVHQICVLESSGAVRCGGGDRTGNLGVSIGGGRVQCCGLMPDAPVFSQIVTGGGWVGGLTRDGGEVWYTGADPVAGGVPGESIPPFRPYRDQSGFDILYAGRNFFTGFQGQTFRWFNRDPAPPLVREQELEIEAAGKTLCAISLDGQLRCWGEDTMRDDYAEEPRDFGGGWSAIALSKYQDSGSDGVSDDHHRCGVRDDGSLWCWGPNENGQLGVDPTMFPIVLELEPERVGDRSDWADVFVGKKHTCGLRQDGSLWCWGRNNEAQLGSDRASGPEPSRVCVPSF